MSTIVSGDLEMNYMDESRFEVTLLDSEGNPNPNQQVILNINGIFYNRYSDGNGVARLNINLMAGEYIITTMYNDLSQSNTIRINA